MPRLTRAQLKAQAEEPAQIHEDESAPETREASPDSDPARPVLKDITATNFAPIESEDAPEIMAPKKSKGKKGGKKNAKKQEDSPVDKMAPQVEVVEDHDQSDNSDAANTAIENLRNDNGVTEPFQVPSDTVRPQTPPSAAVNEATRSLSPIKRTPAVAKTPRFEPSEHITPVRADGEEHDSFVGTCQKASPFKLPMSQEPPEEGSDSFVEQIIARSPSKPMARIEDSVDAIDALEDAIEQVATELPALGAEQLLSPIKKSTFETASGRQSMKRKLATSSTPARSGSVKSLSSKASSTKLSPAKSPVKDLAKSPLRSGSGAQKPMTSNRPTIRISSKSTAPRPVAAKDTAETAATKLAAAVAPQISFSNSPAKPRANTTHKRALGSILPSVKVPFVPKPSSKPPTTSTFTLPGEAVAAKLKTEREERQKRMEAGEKLKPAKPASIVKRTVSAEKRAPTVPSYQLPGDAVAAKLKAEREERQRRIEAVEEQKPVKPAPLVKRTVSAERKAPTAPSYQLPGDAVAAKLKAQRLERVNTAEADTKEKAKTFRARPVPTPRASIAPRENKASAMRMSVVQREDSIKRRGSDKENMAPPRSMQSQAPIPNQRLEVKKTRNSMGPSGKIANPVVSRRSMNLSNQNVQERKAEPTVVLSRVEKEEAARKARAEAAERGRLASREWAEKQRKRLEASKVKSKRESAMNKELEDILEVARLKGQVA